MAFYTYTDLFGNWSYTLTDVKDRIYPKSFEVYQNYPNPFNPSTIISFSVVKSANTRIEIYDILGRLVDAKEFFLQGGDYSIKYEGLGSAGIYFYTIKSGSKSITKKMIQLDGGNGKGLQDLQNGSSSVLRKLVNRESTELKLFFSKFAYVSDTLNYRVQIFSSNGTFLRMFGTHGDRPGSFAHPGGIATDSQGHIYAVDKQYENVQIFDHEGNILMAFGAEGNAPGDFWLPSGIFISPDDHVYIADSFNKRIQVFEYLA